MSVKGHVVIVDAYHPTRRLAPEFVKAGYACVRVQSTPEIPKVYRSTFSLDNYAANIVHRGDLAETVRAVSAYGPVAVVPGGEFGVEFADVLSEALSLPTNGTALSPARRDKYTMVETIKRAGVPGSEQILVSDEEQLREWHTKLGRRVVVKPIRSTGGDGIHFCDTPDESVAAYRALARAENFFSVGNEGVVAQEYLVGGEYVVNTVSRDGEHHVTDIWKTTRITANGVLDLCDSVHLLTRRSPEGEVLGRYAYDVLDALGIRHGPGHLEIKLTPDGPRLVEAGARIAGGDIPFYASLGTGSSQIDWTVDAYVAPERFHERRAEDYVVRQHFASVAMISPKSGTLKGFRNLDVIEKLESLHEIRTLVAPGGEIRPTVDDLTYPMIVNLRHEVAEVVLRDYGTLRFLDGEGLYELS
ncbi:ATP-grasp domain-containing protein [Streptomyces sp. NPDC029216]|uniref:ATP-grasp domain-containing protein n=1 Tax=Streptomyces sp. NPDC029216 TaxID=3154701 RepID=UPI0034000FE8